ncbi:MAG: hypothetical protein QCH96_07510 [Candidatus Thermoplasmatota archaeon]|nr:hypothetical protein [Candidatus Thermoplasmatota archaeon]
MQRTLVELHAKDVYGGSHIEQTEEASFRCLFRKYNQMNYTQTMSGRAYKAGIISFLVPQISSSKLRAMDVW